MTDEDIIVGIQKRNRKVETEFYNSAKRYYNEHFNDVFFDKDRKQEIFQTAFLKLWTEIENGKIKLMNGTVCRQQINTGEYLPMTCRLNTFLMAFAKNEYRELVRTNRLDTYADVYDNVDTTTMTVDTFGMEEDIETVKTRIIDECIQSMSPRCIEVLTLFYYEGKSLDEILEIRQEKNSSKNGLKTSKNKCMNTLRQRVQSAWMKLESTTI